MLKMTQLNKNKVVYNKYFIFLKNKNKIFFFKKMGCILSYIYLNFFFINNINLNLYYLTCIGNNNLPLFFWGFFIVKKIKFKHKISWVYLRRKNLQILKINSNYSHKILFFFNFCRIKRKRDYFKLHVIIFWGLSLNLLINLMKNIISFLPFNKYTQRGFRFARQKIYKKIGKISKYSNLKSKVF